MAVAHVQSTSDTGGDDGTGKVVGTAYDSSNTAGNLLVAFVNADSLGSRTFTVTDTQGNAWSQADPSSGTPFYDSNWGQCIGFAYAPNCKSGANTVSCTFSGFVNFRSIIIAEFSGVATSTPLDGVAACLTVAAATTLATNSLTTTASGDLIVGCGFLRDTSGTVTMGAGSGFSVATSALLQGYPQALIWGAAGTAGSYPAIFTASSSKDGSIGAISFKAAASSPNGGGVSAWLIA